MNERDLLGSWTAQKLAHNFHRLAEPFETEFEFVRQRGHPSSYAFVRFQAIPADESSLHFSVDWPAELDEVYSTRIRHAIAEGVLDALYGSSHYPYRGLTLTLVAFGWDQLGGSEVAVHRATTEAMHHLKTHARWEVVGGRYRSYE